MKGRVLPPDSALAELIDADVVRGFLRDQYEKDTRGYWDRMHHSVKKLLTAFVRDVLSTRGCALFHTERNGTSHFVTLEDLSRFARESWGES